MHPPVGALLTGVIGIGVAGSRDEVVVAAAFLVCVLVLAGLAAGLAVDLLRRPPVAVDGPSSLFDDQVRWVDARWTLYPPAVLAFVVFAGSTAETGFFLIFMAYAVGAPAISLTVELIARNTSPVALAWESARQAQTPVSGPAPR